MPWFVLEEKLGDILLLPSTPEIMQPLFILSVSQTWPLCKVPMFHRCHRKIWHTIFSLTLFIGCFCWGGGTGDRTQGMAHAKPVLYLWVLPRTPYYFFWWVSDAWHLDLDQVKQWCQNQDARSGRQSGMRSSRVTMKNKDLKCKDCWTGFSPALLRS